MDIFLESNSTPPPYNANTHDPNLMQSLVNATDSSMSKSVVFPTAMFIFGVLGNVTAIVILTIRPSKDSRATAFYNLVKALVFTDLLGIVALSPVTIAVYIKGSGVRDTGGMALCHYFSFVLVWAGDSTMFLVLIMACERFLVTKFPFQYTRIVKPLTVNCSILAAVSAATLMGVLPIIGVGSNRDHWPGTWCFFDIHSDSVGNRFLSFFYAILGLVIVIVTIGLNLTVIRHMWRMRKIRLTASLRTASFRSPGESKSNGPDSERRMVIFLMAIIVVFTICYVPFMVRVLMNQMFVAGEHLPSSDSGVAMNDILNLWALRLASLNQIIDPWIYIISRVTCCKGPKSREDDSLLDSRRTSPSSNRRVQVKQTQQPPPDVSGVTTASTNGGTSHANNICSNGGHRLSGNPLSRYLHRMRQVLVKKPTTRGVNNVEDVSELPLTQTEGVSVPSSHPVALGV